MLLTKTTKTIPSKVNVIPESILNNDALNGAIATLPSNYSFEIHKTIWQIQRAGATRVALQFPEGLLMYSLTICDILTEFSGVETLVMGDVTYGACCIDDFTAVAIGCDFMVHYGHSCLVPVNVTKIKTLYVFVDISLDLAHFVGTVKKNIEFDKRILLVGTIQFVASLQVAANELSDYKVTIPQSKPLSPGEILGCTAPKFQGQDMIVYLGDGRFHLEAIMIANPSLPAYRYDPYAKKFTREVYDHETMAHLRCNAIQVASKAKMFGLILGTLGRQGSPKVFSYLEEQLTKAGKDYVTVLLSEITPKTLASFVGVDAWIQVACPRLSIDWGHGFEAPLLTPYESAIVLNQILPWHSKQESYPMDFYASDSLGPWTPNYRDPSTLPKSKIRRDKPLI